jgi:DNA-binding IclR family transcriptional regulator
MPSGALERAVVLLQVLGGRPDDLTVAELANRAGMPTSTAYRLLGELEHHGLVQRGSDSTVALGTGLVALGRTAEAGLRERIVEPASPVMRDLCTEVGETVILTAPCGLEAIVLHVVEAQVHSVRLSYAAFRRAPMHRGASGKVLAAYLEPGGRERLLAAVEMPALEAELEQVRRDGWVSTAGELDEGAAAVAAPVLDRRGRLVAGLSVAGPAARITPNVTGMTAAVVAAARKVERRIGPTQPV